MKFSTRVEYGVLALTDIALHTENGDSVSAPEIADRQKISQKYLEQILTHLKQAGLIRSQKGLRGGYTLARKVEEIRLSDVLNALDTSILEEMTPGENGDGSALRDAVNTCLWKKLNGLITEFTEKKSLAEFARECREKTPDSWDLYII